MKNALAIIIILGLLVSCKKDTTLSNIQLRILNATSGTIYNCIVDPGGTSGKYNYGQISVDSLSSYKTFSEAYRYGYVSLMLNNNTYTIQPYDYVGDTPLEKGKYTYKVTFSSTSGLQTTLIKD